MPSSTVDTCAPQMITRRQAHQCALKLKPPPNPALPALLAKYNVKSWLAPFVSDIHEVKADGHCGFRAIATSLGRSPDDWLFIRESLAATLEQHTETFTEKQLPGTRAEALSRLRTNKLNVVLEQEHWLSMPGFGGLIATTFDRPVIYYDPAGSSLVTFPFLSPPNENPPIVLAFHNSHFCSLTLDYTLTDLPVPRLDPIWRRNHTLNASTWSDRWKPLIEKHQAFLDGIRKSKRRKQAPPISIEWYQSTTLVMPLFSSLSQFFKHSNISFSKNTDVI